MIHVVAVITAKPGRRDAVLKAFRDNVPAVQAEKGCIEYGAAVDMPNGPAFQVPYGADTLLVIEKWDDMEALKAHGASAHMKAYGERTRDLVANRTIHILSPA
ncbi:MAG: putative quinol monooxygenase [Burkholderiaceae bacterium]